MASTPSQLIEFVNRLSEIHLITNIYCPRYLLLSAPTGYGKTRLIEAVKTELQKQDWLCVYLELAREKSYTVQDLASGILYQIDKEPVGDSEVANPEKAGNAIGKRVLKASKKTQKNVILLVDETESLVDKVVQAFLNQCLVELNKMLSPAGISLRVILSGRYISRWEQLPGLKIPLTSLPLTPFDFTAVQQTVNSFDSKSGFGLSEEHRRQFASHLMYYTGGHPKCMATILSEAYPGAIDSKEEEYYQKVVKPVIDEIKTHIPAELVNIFERLSTVRRFNARLLNQFIQEGLITWSQSDGYLLENRLLKTYLVSKKNGFLYDDLTRRILAVHLRRNDLTHYCRVGAQSIMFYESELQDPTSPNPDILAVELLFQKLQMLVYKQQGGKEQFLNNLPEILNLLVSGRSPREREILDAFTERLNDDWEFRFLFNYLLREGIYDNERPFQELMEKIKGFTQRF
jgi:hypothetical protein